MRIIRYEKKKQKPTSPTIIKRIIINKCKRIFFLDFETSRECVGFTKTWGFFFIYFLKVCEQLHNRAIPLRLYNSKNGHLRAMDFFFLVFWYIEQTVYWITLVTLYLTIYRRVPISIKLHVYVIILTAQLSTYGSVAQ